MNIDSHWNLLDYLSEVCRDPFEAIVGKFVFKPPWRMKYAPILSSENKNDEEEDGLSLNQKADHEDDKKRWKHMNCIAMHFRLLRLRRKGSAAAATGLDAAAMAELKEAEDMYARDLLDWRSK